MSVLTVSDTTGNLISSYVLPFFFHKSFTILLFRLNWAISLFCNVGLEAKKLQETKKWLESVAKKTGIWGLLNYGSYY